jgi:hypothetical protein
MKRLCSCILAVLLVPCISTCSIQHASDVQPSPVPASAATPLPQPTATPAAGPTLPPDLAEIRQLLPVGAITADLMQPVSPPRLTELSTKFQAAIQQNPEWWSEYVQNTPAGQTVPYHPNMGLSEGEYAEMLALFDELGLQKTAEVTIMVTASGENHFVLDGGTALPYLTGIEIILDQDLVRTPYGVASQHTAIAPDDAQQLTGPWKGIQWFLDTRDPQQATSTGIHIEFALGRLQQDGRCLMYYRVQQFESAGKTVDLMIVLFYTP